MRLDKRLASSLQESDLFRELPPPESAILAAAFDSHFFPAGTVLYRRGAAGRALYIVGSGGVYVELATGLDRTLDRVPLGSKRLCGEMSLLSGQPVSASVIAARDSWIYVLEKSRFEELLGAHPRLLLPFAQILIARLRHRTSQAAVAAAPQTLFVVAENHQSLPIIAAMVAEAVGLYGAVAATLVVKGQVARGPAADSWLSSLGPPPVFWDTLVLRQGSHAVCVEIVAATKTIEWWRSSGESGAYLIVAASAKEVTCGTDPLPQGRQLAHRQQLG